MSRNHAEDTLETRLLSRITTLEKAVLALSTPQPVGGDILSVIATTGGLAGPFNLNASSFTILTVQLVPDQKPMLWNEGITIYVDALDHQHAWPMVVDGTGTLTAAQQNLRVSVWQDVEDTDFTNGKVMIKAYVLNVDTSAHSIWYCFRGFTTKQTGV